MRLFSTVFAIGLFSCSAVYAAQPASCPFTPAELETVLGEKFEEGKVGFESDFGTGRSLSCNYRGKLFSLSVNQTVMKNPTQTQGWDKMLAGKKEVLANDPDNAVVQTDQGDLTQPNISYVRQGDIVTLRIQGVGKSNPKFSAIQSKLQQLRRLP